MVTSKLPRFLEIKMSFEGGNHHKTNILKFQVNRARCVPFDAETLKMLILALSENVTLFLKLIYTGTTGSTLMTDRFKFWQATQNPNESVQDWEVRTRQAGSFM